MMSWLVASLFLMSTVLLEHCGYARICEDPIPGVSNMVRGLDLKSLDVVPREGFVVHGLRYPVIKYTCSDPNKKTSFRIGGKYFVMPDQISNVYPVAGGVTTKSVNLIKTVEDLKNSFGASVGFGGNVLQYAFSASPTYKKIENIITSNTSIFSELVTHEAAIRADLRTAYVLELDENAKYFVDNMLIKSYELDPETYNEFIRLFGTHYFKNAYFGGMIKSYSEIDKSFSSTKTNTEIGFQVEAAFDAFVAGVSTDLGVTSSTSNVEESFTNASSTNIRYYGGSANLYGKGSLDNWQNSVDTDPWLYSGSIQEIYKLVKDEFKQENLKKAIEQYLNTVEL